MKKLMMMLALVLAPMTGFAAGGHVELESANIDVSNDAAIQRGAKMFVNYCMGCHSAKYVRYKQLTEVGLSEDEIRDNLMFTDSKIGDQMTIAMPNAQAANWFGAPPPDLTLIARIKDGGADWLYSYLKAFYVDESRPLGVNNTVFPNVGMPHVMWDLQGIQEAVYKYAVTHHGHVAGSFDTEADAEAYIKENAGEHGEGYKIEKVVDRLELVKPGKMSQDQYSAAVRDLATFLAYISEPMKLERQSLGVWVILFLIVFTIVAYLMKKEYWKDIH